MLHMEDNINKQYIWRTQEHKEMEKDQTWTSNTRPIFIASTENKDQTKDGYDRWIGHNAMSSLPFFLKFFLIQNFPLLSLNMSKPTHCMWKAEYIYMQKQPSILTIRRIQFWIQNTSRKVSKFNFNIDKTKFI